MENKILIEIKEGIESLQKTLDEYQTNTLEICGRM